MGQGVVHDCSQGVGHGVVHSCGQGVGHGGSRCGWGVGHGGCGLNRFGGAGWQSVGFKFDSSRLIVVPVLGFGFESVVLGL